MALPLLAAAAVAAGPAGPAAPAAPPGTVAAPLAYAARAGDGGRTVLADDPAGSGRVVEVIGDLAAADDIAVVVPGSGQNRENFHASAANPGTVPLDNGRALHAAMRDRRPDRAAAVVVWLGYLPPQRVDAEAVTTTRAAVGAAELARFGRDHLPGGAHVTLVCHSYGSTVCGLAAREAGVADDVVALASPGMGVDGAGEVRARVWATRADDDWIRFVPSFSAGVLGLGGDPMDPAFGARTFSAGDASGHEQYYRRGGAALAGIAAIAAGAAPPTTRPGDGAPDAEGPA
ncbi:alpha/beta hydrolase [Nocardiopsis trehalosi]|uniref:alpha/beta hydrolase n=1 Tax=Nocardiopsis trehalosi TaxID=109329 RepID=UPI000830E4BE|nr:alpha/beta hydrolase [Nocardiopsis trehalosi]